MALVVAENKGAIMEKIYIPIMEGIDVVTGKYVSGDLHCITLNPNRDEIHPYSTEEIVKLYWIVSFDRNPNESLKLGVNAWVVKDHPLHIIGWREKNNKIK